MKKRILLFLTLASSVGVLQSAIADTATLPLITVGGAVGACGLIQVPAGDFNAGGYLAVDTSTPGGRSILATAMLAFAMGRELFISRQSQAVGCYGLTDYAVDVRIGPPSSN